MSEQRTKSPSQLDAIGALVSIICSIATLLASSPFFGVVAIAIAAVLFIQSLSREQFWQKGVAFTITLFAGFALFFTMQPATIMVYIDENHNATHESFEMPASGGLRVTLIDSSGNRREQYTDNEGTASFPGVPFGSISIQVEGGKQTGRKISLFEHKVAIDITPTPSPTPTPTVTPTPT
ncbi:MAG: hypothetical protein GY805_06350, partial [Chloroflexi bacterium]|nr:hypothetical protein [Chloroflexota bacterium]